MRTKTLALALTLAVIAVVVPVTFVFAHRGAGSFYYRATENRIEDEDWWSEMRDYMEERWDELDEAKEQEKTSEEFTDWWDEMRDHMEERWAELEDGGYYRYGRSRGYGGYSRYGGCHW